MSDSWVLIGHAYVDSGQLCISDPCYDWDYDKDILPIALKAIDDNKSTYVYDEGVAVIASTLYGDGAYPVYARFDEKNRATAIMVDFDPPEEDDEY